MRPTRGPRPTWTMFRARPNTPRQPDVWILLALCLAVSLPALFQAGWGSGMNRSLSRTWIQKIRYDEFLAQGDKSAWYRVDLDSITDPTLTAKFVQSHCDAESQAFISQSVDKSNWLLNQIWQSLAKRFLSFFYSQTDINGMLERGSMFVLSRDQWFSLTQWDPTVQKSTLIDLGAGDGGPTRTLAPHFQTVYATEASPAMRKLLSRQGFEVLPIDEWSQDRRYDVVACLNLLDRCDEPLTVLEQIKGSLEPDGLVALAVVLPFKPYVEFAADHTPKQKIPFASRTFEGQVQELQKILNQLGFEIVRWTKVPYLCEGDLSSSVYNLNDAVFILKVGDSVLNCDVTDQ
ncbi:protein-L-histidine N-pros-methyltransferase-like isoform X1 [Tigriopus californicus]|uniref:protein-L-histidine N-pros-methyltransferase-like isoform X1 n=1 Tax=Tigriopus californicus TaxID=6832 RepID=UPI0027DA0179|nr:protein-L-histidine N-pros-methyltransferase-like isoform X1 [Tigriopus californicus]